MDERVLPMRTFKSRTNTAKLPFILILSLALLLFTLCAGAEQAAGQQMSSDGEVMGFGILGRLPGLWNGPVFTSTPAGSFENWYVDFRPVASGQVSQYCTLDANTVNYLTFLIVKRDGLLKVAMRTEGVFQNKGCVTYEIIDAVDESKGYYRFSDFKAGTERAYTEFFFTGERLIMDVYTNRFNKVSPLELHSRWTAKRADTRAAAAAVKHFDFPQALMVRDFTNTFKNMSESIFFTFENDPYPSSSQPYVGHVTVNLGIAGNLPVKPTDELFLLLTTQSLFEGLVYNPENLKYISRYVYLPPDAKEYTFTHVHPGAYFLYSYNDLNNDKKHKTGDYMSSNIHNTFTLPEKSKVVVKTIIDYIIP